VGDDVVELASNAQYVQIQLRFLTVAMENSRSFSIAHMKNDKASMCIFEARVYASQDAADTVQLPDTTSGSLDLTSVTFLHGSKVSYNCGRGRAFQWQGNPVTSLNYTCEKESSSHFDICNNINPTEDCGYLEGAWSPNPKDLPSCICMLDLSITNL